MRPNGAADRASPTATRPAPNRRHAKIRALGEHAVATLKMWKILAKLRCGRTEPNHRDAVNEVGPAASTNARTDRVLTLPGGGRAALIQPRPDWPAW